MNEIAAIAERAAKRNLPLLVAGGLAVEVHGYQRKTFDADLVIRRANRDAWLELMRELGFSVFREGPVFLQLNPPEGSDLPPVDLMFLNDETFGKLTATAIPNPYSPDLPRIISLESLVAMKCHAIRHGHAGRLVKDADDLIHLFLANRLDPEAGEWREVILKFGTEELYEKIRRIVKSARALDLDLPDWSGMDRFTPRLSPKDALRRNEKSRRTIPANECSKTRLPKCEIEFVL